MVLAGGSICSCLSTCKLQVVPELLPQGLANLLTNYQGCMAGGDAQLEEGSCRGSLLFSMPHLPDLTLCNYVQFRPEETGDRMLWDGRNRDGEA